MARLCDWSVFCVVLVCLCFAGTDFEATARFLQQETANTTELSHTCIHSQLDYPTADPSLRSRWVKSIAEKKITPSSIRIYFDTTPLTTTNYDPSTCYTATGSVSVTTGGSTSIVECTSSNSVTASKVSLLESRLFPMAAAIIQSAILVSQALQGLVQTSLSSCIGMAIPSKYRTNKGPKNVDLVILVGGRPTPSGVLAYAGPCVYDASTGRSIMGLMNVGLNILDSVTQGSGYERQMAFVMAHEMIHVLGFSSSVIASMDTQVSYPATNYATAYTVSSLSGSNLLNHASAFYGCSSIQGIPLEDSGGAGSAGAHWEKRLFPNEIMSSTLSKYPVVSSFTVAMLTDIQWYSPNPTFKDTDFVFGWNQGCSFVKSRCDAWTAQLPDAYRCTGSGNACFIDKKQKAQCSLARLSYNIPTQYRISSDPTLGGYDSYADNCPMWTPVCSCEYPDTCSSVSDGITYLGESYGEASMCIQRTVLRSGINSVGESGACYQTACKGPNKLFVKVAGVFHDCSNDSELKINVVEGVCFEGSFICPDVSICKDAPVDSTWPRVDFVEPSGGSIKEGSTITLTGSNFLNLLSIAMWCGQSVEFKTTSNTELTFVVPKSTSAGLGSVTTIVLTDASGRTAYVENISVTKGADSSNSGSGSASSASEFFQNAGSWFSDTQKKYVWFAPVIGGSFLVLVLSCCLYCRHKKSKPSKKHQSDKEMYGLSY